MSDTSLDTKSQNGYFQNARPDMLKYIPESAKTVLEVGCSEGNFCRSMKTPERKIWGIEINPEAARKASESCDFVLCGNFDELYDDLPKAYFDCVVFNDVLEHRYAPWDTLKKTRALLKPDGVVVSSIPNFRYIGNLVTEIFWEEDFRYKPEGGILDDTHIRFFTSKSILRMYREQGFEVVRHEGITPCKSWKEKLFIRLTLGKLKDARWKRFATVARKIE